MKFLNFINEDINHDKVYGLYKDLEPDEIVKIIERDCMQFLKEDIPLYRGYDFRPYFFSKTPRKNRKPLDTPNNVHDYLDNYFKKKFGWKPRSEGVFVTPNITQAFDYGTAYLFFPVDGYKYIWSKNIDDLFIIIKNKLHEYTLDNIDVVSKIGSFSDHIDDLTKDQFNEFMKILEDEYLNTYINNRIQLNKKNEVMVKCDKYYMLNYRYYKNSKIMLY